MKSLLAALLLLSTPAAALAAPAASAASEKVRLETELEGLARRIEAKKEQARQDRAVLPDPELQELLQRAQLLADRLSALREAERRGPGPVAPAPADDPREIREQADLLRDRRDRILGQLAEVEKRLAEAREEAAVARELRDFLDENDLFDESDRVLRASRSVRAAADSGGGPRGPPTNEAEDVDSGGSGDSLGSSGSIDPPGGGSGSALISGTRPTGVGDPGSRRLPVLDGDESAPELVARQRELQGLAKKLEREADALDARARTLGN